MLAALFVNERTAMSITWIQASAGRTGPLADTVQYLLNERGYGLTVDGQIGPATTAAIEAFQQANSLAVDGIVGNQTWPALIVEIRQGDEGDAVRAAQDQLRYRDLPECKNLAVDGIFGPLTDAAVRAFQTYVSANQSALLEEPMPVDGVVTENTWYALVMDLGPLPE
jgi:peptidoglycan hydrolase-like protein with peptidoglycan-binding domain